MSLKRDGKLSVSDKTIIGSTSVTPDGTLHVHTGSAGSVSPVSNADDLVIENSGSGGISLLTPDASVSNIYFGSVSSNLGAFIRWGYSTNTFDVGTVKVGASLRLSGGNAVTNLTLSGASGSELATFAGDVTLSNGKVSITDTANEIALNVTSSATSVAAVNVSAPTGGNLMTLTNSHASLPYGINLSFSAAAPDDNTQYAFRFADSSDLRAILYSDGDWANHDGTYGTISDAKLKTDFQATRSYWNDFKALQYKKYRMLSDIEQYGDDAEYRIGLVAQETAEVFPGLVKEGADGNLFIKSSIIDGVINSIVLQEAMARIEELEKKIHELTS
jgi:hypothetical protein